MSRFALRLASERERELEERIHTGGDAPFRHFRLERADVLWLLKSREYTNLQEANLSGADLQRIEFYPANLQEANLSKAQLQHAYFSRINLQKANLSEANIQNANFSNADLREASLRSAYLQGANLFKAKLHGTDLFLANLQGAHLSNAQCDSATDLAGVRFHDDADSAYLADVGWNTVNLAAVQDWDTLILGEERRVTTTPVRYVYEDAARATRQLALSLQSQGMEKTAARFDYRSRKFQERVYRCDKQWGPYLFSRFLWLVTGYGYKPWRSGLAYLSIVVVFALLYSILGTATDSTRGGLARSLDALVTSVSAFHGRVTSGDIAATLPDTRHDTAWIYVATSAEAILGLVIEATFIAAVARRFFGK